MRINLSDMGFEHRWCMREIREANSRKVVPPRGDLSTPMVVAVARTAPEPAATAPAGVIPAEEEVDTWPPRSTAGTRAGHRRQRIRPHLTQNGLERVFVGW